MPTPSQGQFLNFGCWKPLSGPKSLQEGEWDDHDLNIQLRCGCPALSTTPSSCPGPGPGSDRLHLLAPTSLGLLPSLNQFLSSPFSSQLYHRP